MLSSVCAGGRRRRGMIELRRDNELDGRDSSSGSNSTCDSRLDIPRGKRVRGVPEEPFKPDRLELLPSRLAGRRTSADPLRAFRGCRDESRPSKYALDWLGRCGVDGADWLAKRLPDDEVEVLWRRSPGFRFPNPKESLDPTSLPAMSRTRIAGSFSNSLTSSRRPYAARSPLCSSLESQMLDMIRRRFRRTAALL